MLVVVIVVIVVVLPVVVIVYIHSFVRSHKEYHRDGSSCRYLSDVRCPLLCINAEDDPICQPGLYPLDSARRNPCVIFVTTTAGGHIGFGEGFNPWGR